jgi:hypothetical protein
LNKIKSTNKIRSVFLAVVIVAGTFALISPAFIVGAQAYPDYGMDNKKYGTDNNSYDKSKKDVIVKKVECENININTNGLDFSGDSIGNSIAAQAAEEDYGQQLSANAFGNSERNNGFKQNDEDVVMKCIQNNNDGEKGKPEEPTTGTLRVTKQIICNVEQVSAGISIQQAATPCQALEELINEDDYNITVTGNNPFPAQFPGSPSGTDVTLDPGSYVIEEKQSIRSDVTDILFRQFPNIAIITFFSPIFTGDCTPAAGPFQVRGIGTIEDGESQTCNIENKFTLGLGTEP